MIQNQTLAKKPLAEIGEEIGKELGKQMVENYQIANPSDVHTYTIGRNVLDLILAQPGCVGIRFFNAYNELGEKTLVYVGFDREGKLILNVSAININGQLCFEKGIVADRVKTGGPGGGPIFPLITPDADNWGFTTND